MADNFQAGDVVHLKSGGPAMTIDSIDEAQGSDPKGARCSWFDEKNAANTKWFPLTSLMKAKRN